MADYGKSGGVGYHLAALLYARNAWRPFREGLASELQRRFSSIPEFHQRPLVIIGPSGGYCFDSKLLSGRSGAVLAIDVDPVAQPIFRLLHRKALRNVALHWRREDFFASLESKGWDLEIWAKDHPVLTRTPFFLFMNVLGQLEFIYSESRLAEIDRGLSRTFAAAKASKIPWISVHDRISFPPRSLFPGKEESALRSDRILSNEELAVTFGTANEIEAHHLGDWVGFAEGEVSYLPWRLSGDSIQVAEFLSSFPV